MITGKFVADIIQIERYVIYFIYNNNNCRSWMLLTATLVLKYKEHEWDTMKIIVDTSG